MDDDFIRNVRRRTSEGGPTTEGGQTKIVTNKSGPYGSTVGLSLKTPWH